MRIVRILIVLVGACAAFADPAGAALFEEKIVFASNRDGDYDIYAMNPDGSGRFQLTNDPAADFAPSISPDGTRIAFTRSSNPDIEGDIILMNADGSGEHVIAPNSGLDPDWSPDGTQLVFGTEGHGAPDGIWIIDADGTDRRFVTWVDRGDVEPSWAPDNSLIAFTVYLNLEFPPEDGIYTVHPDGTGLRRITFPPPDTTDENADFRFDSAKIAFDGIAVMNPDGSGLQGAGVGGSDPSWSPDGTKFALVKAFVVSGKFQQEIYRANFSGGGETPLTNDMANAIDPVWGNLSVLVGPGYPRPKGASPLRVALVPAYDRCTTPNNTHANPLAFGSCSPPRLSSQYLTAGTPDANGRPARMSAHLLLAAIPGGPSEADEADVQIAAHLNDVLNKDLSDYTGELRANLPIRITDRDNLPPVGGPGPGTTQPFAFGFDIPCTADPAPLVGSDCSLATTVDTLVPGAIKETRRTIWQMGQVRVFDGGADGDGSTAGDNTVFAAQGVFIP